MIQHKYIIRDIQTGKYFNYYHGGMYFTRDIGDCAFYSSPVVAMGNIEEYQNEIKEKAISNVYLEVKEIIIIK